MSTIRKKYVSSMEDYGNLDRNYTKDLEKRIKEVCNKAFLYTLVFDYYDYKTFRYLVEIDIDPIDPSQEETILES